MSLGRYGLTSLRAALWGVRALTRTRRTLKENGLASPALPRVPDLPVAARRGAAGALRRLNATCLERATVLQAWDAAHDVRRDLVIGVTSPREGFRAHAWLDGDAPCHDEGFTELLRRPPQ